MKKRKNIALFIGMMETEFTRSICEGALLGAQEIDANLIILPAGLIDGDYRDKDFDEYRRQYNILYSYASLCSFDAIILEYGTITSVLNEEKKKELLQQMEDVPVVLIASDVEGYSSICIDNKTGMREAVAHLIEHHQCTKIGFVSGPKTSQDANERLQVYRDTMQEYHLEVKEQWITYGNFTEYCTDQMEEFISRNQELDAIVFANDQMAMAGYIAMERLNLKPKDDIRIIGFDDNPIAMLLEPHLSSVKLDSKELGYRAVLACTDVIAGKEVHQNVAPRLITRESCGCDDSDMIGRTVESMLGETTEELLRHFAKDMLNNYFSIYFDNEEKVHIYETLESYFRYFFHISLGDGSMNLDEEEFAKEYRKYTQVCQRGHINVKDFLIMDQVLYEYLRVKIQKEEDRLRLLELIMVLRRELLGVITTRNSVLDEKNKLYEPIMASVVSDMLCYSRDERKIYKTVIDKFRKMEYPSSCIIMYDNAIGMRSDRKWTLPEHYYIKAYHDHDKVELFQGEEKEVDITKIFTSRWTPGDRRYNMLLIPLFSNQRQHGLLLLETDVDYFQYAIEIARQISVAIEVIEIIRRQNEIKDELESNLAKTVETNRILDEMSRKDPLTSILNRRGFLDYVKKIVSNTENYGKRALAVYADMDNLKIINDEFGHDEGDYSLRIIAKALSESFRQTDVVARMGGDEFAAFAIVGQDRFPEKIRERICSVLEELNENNGKPYYVNMSLGFAEFVIDESVSIEHVLTEADQNLYYEKKHKKKVVYKES